MTADDTDEKTAPKTPRRKVARKVERPRRPEPEPEPAPGAATEGPEATDDVPDDAPKEGDAAGKKAKAADGGQGGSGSDDEPSGGDGGPSGDDESSGRDRDEPSGDGDEPSGDGDEPPSGDGDGSSGGDDGPSGGDDGPSGGGDEPSGADGDDPSGGDGDESSGPSGEISEDDGPEKRRERSRDGDGKDASSGEGFTRQVDREKKDKEGNIRRIAPTRAQDVIQQQVQKRTVDPTKVKLPQFPAPASERPEALKNEEQRREEIAAKEQVRREEILSDLDEDQRVKLEHDWDHQDKLQYKPDPDDREIEIYEIRPPHAYVQIVKNQRTHEMLYHAIEPKLSRDERVLLDFIEETLVDVLDLQPEELEKAELEEYIRGKFEEVLFDYSISLGDEEADADEAKERLLYYVLRDFIGEGPINILMEDPMIEDISCDGPHVPVFVYHRKYEALTTTIRFAGHDELDSFVIRMAQRAGKHVSIAEPILDATMKDGSRLQATLAKEVSSFGSTFTIRKFREVPFTPIDLVRFGTMSSAMLSYFWMVIENHMSGIYAGGTASGKTTAINALLMFIPPQNKVVTIEDTRELRVPEPNWIAGITRDGFGPRDAHGRQAGEIDMFQLLKNALRQRPEYIVVGEVRGAEAYNLFQAMATGHAAYGTMHADSVDAVIHRLESDPINIPRSLLEALDVVAVQMQTRVGGKRVRRTKQLTEIVGLDPNTREILTNEVFAWNPATDSFEYSGVSYALERIAMESGQSTKEVSQEMEDRVRLINHLVDIDLREYGTIAQVIKNYYKDKERVMAKVEAGEGWD